MQCLDGALLPNHGDERLQIGRAPEGDSAEIRSAARLLGSELMRCGNGLAHHPSFLQLSREARSAIALRKRNDQDASIELGPYPLTNHRARQLQQAREMTIAPLQAVVIALLTL